MAEEPDDTEKTEDPTQKRLDEALKRGDVVKSQEVNTWFIIAGATLVLMAFSGSMSQDLTTTMRGLIANAHDIRVDGPALPRLFEKIGVELIAAVAIPFLLLMLAALGGNLIQHRLSGRSSCWRPSCPKFRRPPASSGCSPSRRSPISPRASSSWCWSARCSPR